MLISKTENIKKKTIVIFHEIVAKETIIGANIFKNVISEIRDRTGSMNNRHYCSI